VSPSRIDELRRRVQNDPASIAFAQLAEEYRRSGQTDEAVRICREGLVRHPGYLSARVTLGRALLDLGNMDEARGEFEFVVVEAPENLAAVRGLAEIFHRGGHSAEALSYYERALALARHDPEIEEIVQQLSRQIGVAASETSGGLSFEEAHQELLTAGDRVPLAPPSAPPPPARDAAEGSTAPFDFDRLVAALGTPAAPPQLEAAVEGRAAPAVELPDPEDLGPNPFAALEAELRAHGVAAEAMSTDQLWESVAAVDGIDDGQSTGGEAAGTAPDDSVDSALTAEAADAPAGTEQFDDTAAGTEEMVWPMPEVPGEMTEMTSPALAVEDADPAVLEEPQLDSLVPDGQLAESGADAPPPSSSEGTDATTRAEDVLDDLESWLNTLQDRSTE